MTRLVHRRLAVVVCDVAWMAIVSTMAAAQPAVSTLSGRVSDPQEAAVPGADITLRQLSTGAVWRVQSDAGGRFLLTLLPPGEFDLDVAVRGFAPWSARAMPLLVGQERQLEVRLQVGAMQDSITLNESTTPSATPALDGVLQAARIESLPLNGRNFLELALLIPGNQPTPNFDPTKTNSVIISSAGQMGRGNNVTIDGQDNNDDAVGGPLLNLPIDAVQEFQIATNRFAADLGRSASSVINIVTRSGGNAYRGTAALFARDAGWQARAATVDASTGKPPFDRQQTSGAFGGPLVRDRLFWFAAGEYRNQDGGVLVGARDTATRTIRRSYAAAPLDDALWTARLDAAGRGTHHFTLRYAGEHAKDTAASAVERAIGSATQRQVSTNRYQHLLGGWTTAPSATMANVLNVSVSHYKNETNPVAIAPQLTFPSLQDGASFRMPQDTTQTRFQVSDTLSFVRGAHALRAGGELQRVDAEFGLGVFQQGRIELTQDFPSFDHTGDGRIDDNDLLFAVTLRSGHPDQALVLPDSDNTHGALFIQDDWRPTDRLLVSAGLRYEVDTDVNNQSRTADLNPIVQPFTGGPRKRDLNNVAPRIGLVWTSPDQRTVLRGGYGIYYDRIVLEIQSLERGLDGRALPIEVRAGNVFFLDPATGLLPPGAPTLANPFTGFILPGAGASGINIIDSRLQNPMVQELHFGVERALGGARLRVDALHDRGTHFVIGRTVGQVFNPVVGGPDRVVNLESSARTHYDALLVSLDARLPGGGALHAGYTLAKAFNYANDDQIPFLNGPIDPDNLGREYGPSPNDRRHRFVLSANTPIAQGVQLSAIWTISSGVPMDIMLPDGSSRIPALQRNAGGRLFTNAGELNAFLTALNASGGVNGAPLPLVAGDARFTDSFNALDLRVSRPFRVGARVRVEPMLELFNAFNTTNILGATTVNYSGYSNVLVRDADEPGAPGYLTSSRFGRPVTTAGGVFGSGGPRALQLGARVTF
jgi:hypothetical protein